MFRYLLTGRLDGPLFPISQTEYLIVPEGDFYSDCSSLTSGTSYYVYLYDNVGVVNMDISTTAWVKNVDGRKVKDGAPLRFLVGTIIPVTIQVGKRGPVDVKDNRGVINSFNKQLVQTSTGWIER